MRGHGGTVAIHSPSTSEVGGSNPGPYVGQQVVAYQWSAVYSTEPTPTIHTLFSALKTGRCDVTCTGLKATINPQ